MNQLAANKNNFNAPNDSRIQKITNYDVKMPSIKNEYNYVGQNESQQYHKNLRDQAQQDNNAINFQQIHNNRDEAEQALIKKKNQIFCDYLIYQKNILNEKKPPYYLESSDAQQLDFKIKQRVKSNQLIKSLKKSFIQRYLTDRNKQNGNLQEKYNINPYLQEQEKFRTAIKTLEELNQNTENQLIQNKQSSQPQKQLDPNIDAQQNFFRHAVKKNSSSKSNQLNNSKNQISNYNSTQKWNYYLNILSKNNLEIMKEETQNIQNALKIDFAETKQKNEPFLKKDQQFQQKLLKQISITAQFQNNIQMPTLNPLHLRKNYSEKFKNNLQLNLIKSQSGKSQALRQFDYEKQQQASKTCQDKSIKKASQFYSFESQMSPRSFLEENYKTNQQDGSLEQPNKFNNKQKLKEKIKQINGNFPNLDMFNNRKQKIQNAKPNNLYYLSDKNQFSCTRTQIKHKITNKKNYSDADQTKSETENSQLTDEYYGPWDINEADNDSNYFPSYNNISNPSECTNQF